jgi:hypothetical protein
VERSTAEPDGGAYDAPRRLALSIPEFCTAHGFSEGMYYKMRKQGLTPREMKVGTRTLITFEAAAQWRAEREAASKVEHKEQPDIHAKTARASERGVAT